MKRNRPAIFRGRHFEPEIIATCVRWYLRFSLSLRNVEEMMAERGLMVNHTTVWRWCQKYGPVIYHRLRGKLKYTTTTWHMDDELHACCAWTGAGSTPQRFEICEPKGAYRRGWTKNQAIRQQSN